MNLYFPDNIFTRILVNNFDDDVKSYVKFFPSSILAKKLNEDSQSLALIPTLDLINNKDLYVSKTVGISFEGSISNSYIYYQAEQSDIKDIRVAGDVSSIEVILCKILFKELYDADVEISIQTKLDTSIPGNYLIVGDENFNNARFKTGISLAEEITEIISAPYVNYILASTNKNVLEDYSSKIKAAVTNTNFEADEILSKLDPISSDFIMEHFKSIVFDLEKQDNLGINELLQLPYFYGFLEDIIEIKFV